MNHGPENHPARKIAWARKSSGRSVPYPFRASFCAGAVIVPLRVPFRCAYRASCRTWAESRCAQDHSKVRHAPCIGYAMSYRRSILLNVSIVPDVPPVRVGALCAGQVVVYEDEPLVVLGQRDVAHVLVLIMTTGTVKWMAVDAEVQRAILGRGR